MKTKTRLIAPHRLQDPPATADEEVIAGIVSWTLDEMSAARATPFGDKSRSAITEKVMARWKKWKEAR